MRIGSPLILFALVGLALSYFAFIPPKKKEQSSGSADLTEFRLKACFYIPLII